MGCTNLKFLDLSWVNDISPDQISQLVQKNSSINKTILTIVDYYGESHNGSGSGGEC